MGAEKIALDGIVKSGLAEGSFFMSLEPYIQAMQENLGYTPFKGTLNLKVDKQQAKAFIDSLKLISIKGFQKGIKKFGGVNCYPCKIREIQCAIIVPEFTRYDLNIVELISDVKIRDSLNLKDGDTLTIHSK